MQLEDRENQVPQESRQAKFEDSQPPEMRFHLSCSHHQYCAFPFSFF